MNPSKGDAGGCFGDSGGPHFLGGTQSNLIVSITAIGDSVCRATDKTFRLDTPSAREFLSGFCHAAVGPTRIGKNGGVTSTPSLGCRPSVPAASSSAAEMLPAGTKPSWRAAVASRQFATSTVPSRCRAG